MPKPRNYNPPLTDAELDARKSAARKWFAAFPTILQQKGINPTDPFALSRIIITKEPSAKQHSFDCSQASDQELQDFVSDNQFQMEYAFMPTDNNGDYEISPGSDSSIFSFIQQNVKPLSEINDVEKLYLYDMACEGRLFIRDNSPQEDAFTNPSAIVVDDNTGYADLYEDIKTLEKNLSGQGAFSKRFKKEKLDKALNVYNQAFSVQQTRSEAQAEYTERLLERISEAENKPQVKQSLISILLESLWRFGRDLKMKNLAMVFADHPLWKNDEKIAQKIEESIEYSNFDSRIQKYIPKEVRERTSACPYGSPLMPDLEKKLAQILGSPDFNAHSKTGKILDNKGNPIEASGDFEYLSKVGSDIIQRKGVYLSYKAKTAFIARNEKDRIEPACSKVYINELERLIKQIEKDTPEYLLNRSGYDVKFNILKETAANFRKSYEENGSVGFDEANRFFTDIVGRAESLFEETPKESDMKKESAVLKNLNRIQDLADFCASRNSTPESSYEFFIAEKLVAANGVILDRNDRKREISRVRRSEVFRLIMLGKTPKQLEKMLKTNGVKLSAQFKKDYEKEIAKPVGKAKKKYLDSMDAVRTIAQSILSEDENAKLADPYGALCRTVASAYVFSERMKDGIKGDESKLIQTLEKDDRFRLYVSNMNRDDLALMKKHPEIFAQKHFVKVSEMLKIKEDPVLSKCKLHARKTDQRKNRAFFFSDYIHEDGKFNDKKLDIRKASGLGLSVSRTSLDSIAFAHLMNSNPDVPINDLTDPFKSCNLMKKAGDAVAEKLNTLTPEAFARFAMDTLCKASISATGLCNQYLAEKQCISIADMQKDENQGLACVLARISDNIQEIHQLQNFLKSTAVEQLKSESVEQPESGYDEQLVKRAEKEVLVCQTLFHGTTKFDGIAVGMFDNYNAASPSELLQLMAKVSVSNDFIKGPLENNKNDIVGEIIKGSPDLGSVIASVRVIEETAFNFAGIGNTPALEQFMPFVSPENRNATIDTLMTRNLPPQLKFNTAENKLEKLEFFARDVKAQKIKLKTQHTSGKKKEEKKPVNESLINDVPSILQ